MRRLVKAIKKKKNGKLLEIVLEWPEACILINFRLEVYCTESHLHC